MENKVAETLLQESQKLTIEGVEYEMSPPSIATLVLASKYIGQLPSKQLDEEHLIAAMIKDAESLIPVGNALAVMILGARGFNEPISRNILRRSHRTKGEVLAEQIINSDVTVVLKQFYKVIEGMRLNDFFQLTTFLIELNLTKPTRRVVKKKKTTASGHS